MDREISGAQRRRQRYKMLVNLAVLALAVAGVVVAFVVFADRRVSRGDITFSTADRGTVETSVEATGKVVAAYEEVIVSPVASRIVEFYRQEGDSVVAGDPILRLDLMATETEVRKMADELDMKKYATRQGSLNSRTLLTNLEMKIEAKEMEVAQLKGELASERRLDSIGSGTGDRVRQAELVYRTALLELEQMKKELANERMVRDAAHKSMMLEESISSRNLSSLQRTLDEARVLAPRDGVITYMIPTAGASVSAGERIAVLADLSKFKIAAEIAEGNGDKLSAGSRGEVIVGNTRYPGTVTRVVPQSTDGLVSFTFHLDNPSDPKLKAGLRAAVNVYYSVLENVVRISNGSYYKGPGVYLMYVESGDRLQLRSISLGESNHDYVEVKSGLNPGEKVAVSDMSAYSGRKTLKIK